MTASPIERSRKNFRKGLWLLILAMLPVALLPMFQYIFNTEPVTMDIGRCKNEDGEINALRELSHQLRWHPRATQVKIIWHPWKLSKPNRIYVMYYDRDKSEYRVHYGNTHDGFSTVTCYFDNESVIHESAREGSQLLVTAQCSVS